MNSTSEMPEFFNLFDGYYEYPGDMVAERGVPQNTFYIYIATTFLNGLINYVKIDKMFLIERYSIMHPIKNQLILEKLGENSGHFNADERLKVDEQFVKEKLDNQYQELFAKIPDDDMILDTLDDLIIFAHTENSLWIFWSDRDCSDSCIGRVDKNKCDMSTFVSLFLKHIQNDFLPDTRRPSSESITGKYLELPIPKNGWITL